MVFAADKENNSNKKAAIDWGRWGEELSKGVDDVASEQSDENTLHKLDDSFLLDFEGNKVEEVLEADDQSFETMEVELLNGL